MSTNPITFTTGTTASTLVSIVGDLKQPNAAGSTSLVYIVEQTGTSTAVSNNLLLGSVTTIGRQITDSKGNNFSNTVVLSGFSTYVLGSTGTPGDIFFVDGSGNLLSVNLLSVTTSLLQ
jgi:hypothetical protein